MTLSKRYFFCFLLLTLLSNGSIAQTVSPTSISINGNILQAKLQVTNSIDIDLVVEFEKSIGLSANNIEISASLIDINSSSVTNRINVDDIKAIPSFPVVISITPRANSGFGFEGLASVEIYTKSIDYNVAMPARLFRSHDNGNFEDITSMVSAGSIRARGNTGSFSDFMILLDERSNTDMIEDTFSQFNQLFNQHSDKVSLVLAMSIQTSINSLKQALLLSDFATALELTESLISITENATGDQMSNIWRSSNDLINMQGELLTRLKTLRFSLRVN
jgi:predicted nucleotidyltransferase